MAAAVLAPSAALAADEDAPQPLATAVGTALDAWTRFTATGDLFSLGSSFASEGPQWRLFEAESAAGELSADGEPLRFEVREFRLRNLDSTTATIWVRVEASRAGFVSEAFGWDFDLILDRGRWRVWTVVEAEPPSDAQVTPLASIVPTTVTTRAPVDEPDIGVDSLAAATSGTSPGTRIPVLSAWIVVITLVGVALAGYMAPRIDRKGEG